MLLMMLFPQLACFVNLLMTFQLTTSCKFRISTLPQKRFEAKFFDTCELLMNELGASCEQDMYELFCFLIHLLATYE